MRKAVFLDRDGTLIRNHHHGCDPNGIELLGGVPEGLGLLKRAGYALVVVTNQSGIARGLFTEGQLAVMHRRLGGLLEERGAGIDGWYYCPHHPEGVVPRYSIACDCRKPRPGMVLRGCSDLGIDPSASWLIGDILDDVEAGKRAGSRAILLEVGTEREPDRPERVPDYVALSFLEAVGHILAARSPDTDGSMGGLASVGRGFIPRRPRVTVDRRRGTRPRPTFSSAGTMAAQRIVLTGSIGLTAGQSALPYVLQRPGGHRRG